MRTCLISPGRALQNLSDGINTCCLGKHRSHQSCASPIRRSHGLKLNCPHHGCHRSASDNQHSEASTRCWRAQQAKPDLMEMNYRGRNVPGVLVCSGAWFCVRFCKVSRAIHRPVNSVPEETDEYDEELAWIRQFCLYILSHI